MNIRKRLLLGVLVIVALALGVGAVLAQGPDDTTPPVGPGYGPGMGGHGRGFGPGYMMNGYSLIEITADVLDMSVEDVYAELAQGISIADLAGDKTDEIVAAALAAHKEALDEAVADGFLSEEQAAWMQSNMESMITTRVNQPWAPGGVMGQGGFGHGRGGMMGGFGRFGGCHGDYDGSGNAFGRPWSSAPAAPQGAGA